MAKEKKDKKALKNAKKDIWNNYSASEKKALEKLCLNYGKKKRMEKIWQRGFKNSF